MKNFFPALILFLMSFATWAQQPVGINTTSPNPDSDLTLGSTDKGLLLNRVALTGTANAAPLLAHVAGMTVYNTATTGDITPGYYYNDGTQWVRIADISLEPWFGTDDDAPATLNTENIYIMGSVGIGTPDPSQKLHIKSNSSGVSVRLEDDDKFWLQGIDALNDFTIWDGLGGASRKLTITETGQVGIGNFFGPPYVGPPTESLDLFEGNVRVRDINTNTGTATDNIVVADATGVLKTIDPSTIGGGSGNTSIMTPDVIGHPIARHDDGTGNVVTIEESLTTLVDNVDGTYSYTNEGGVVTSFPVIGASSAATNGYITLGDIIIQWGTLSGVSLNQTFHPVTFPIAFPNGALNINATIHRTAVVSGNITTMVRNATATGCQIAGDHDTTTATGNIQWIAIGH